MAKTFVDGIRAEKPNEKAPRWVKAKISIKIDEFLDSATKLVSPNGWLNLDLLESQKGTYYLAVNEYKPLEKPEFIKEAEKKVAEQKAEDDSIPYPEEEIDVNSIPF